MKSDRSIVGLIDLARDPSQAAEIDPSDIPALLAQLSAVQSSIAARWISANRDSSNTPDDKLLDVEEAAGRLGVSEDWLYRRTNALPFVVRVGRRVRFSATGIDRYIRNRMGR